MNTAAIEDLEDAILALKRSLEKPKCYEQKTTRTGNYGAAPEPPPGEGWRLVGMLVDMDPSPQFAEHIVFFYWQREVSS